MRILITNDDGIHAPGIAHLIAWAQKLGEVVVAAPTVEQSAKSHAIEIRNRFRATRVTLPGGVTGYSVGSTPADCVRFALLGLGEKFDLVLSGINRGLNIGCDILYSGTVAAVFEAAIQGVPAVAVSTEPASFDSAVAHLDTVYHYMMEHDMFRVTSWYNVNIPLEVRGIRVTCQGGPYYSDEFLPQGDDWYLPSGKSIYAPGDPARDTDTVLTHRCISIMPITVNRTDMGAYNALTHLHP